MDSIPQQLLLQVILILINAFFAMTEIAVISLNAGKLRMMAEEGDKTAPRLLKLVEEPSGFLSTIQIAITLAGFLSSAFAADSFAGYLVDWVYTDLGFQSLSRGTLNTLSVIVITLILFVFFAVGIIMPIVILILESCMLKEGVYSLSNFTLHYWIGDPDPKIMEGMPGIFKNSDFIKALLNSLRLTLVNGVFGTIFGQMLGYICAKGRGKFHGKLVEQLVFIPYLIPSVAFGGIYLSMFSQPQTLFGVTLVPALYGTFALLTLVSVVKHLPFASRAGTSNMLQISGELEEAATIEGAGFFKRFVKIVFPLSKGGFISGFMLIFVSIMKELDLIILIMTPTTSTLPYLAFQYQNGNSPQASNCVAIVMFAIVFLVYALANIFGDADLAKSMAG